jgi:hypothetical protein
MEREPEGEVKMGCCGFINTFNAVKRYGYNNHILDY